MADPAGKIVGGRHEFPVLASPGRHRLLRWQVFVTAERHTGAGWAPADFPQAAAPGRWRGAVWTRANRGKDGAWVTSAPSYVEAGKNLGRRNATTPLTQALALARARHRKRAGAVGDGGGAPPRPMLARRAEPGLGPADYASGVLVQRKFNGVRCLAARGALFSRGGRRYRLPDVEAEVAALLGAAPAGQEGLVLDGELYRHGRPLQEISGLARAAHAAPQTGLGLGYFLYDCYLPGRPEASGAARQRWLSELFAQRPGPLALLQRASGLRVRGAAELQACLQRFLAEGYEGLIARRLAGPYLPGRRSADLLKYKPLRDEEYTLVGYADGQGKDAGAVIWLCRTAGGREFAVVPKAMPYALRYHIHAHLADAAGAAGETRFGRDFRGQALTVEFPELSQDGVPVQAKALGFRGADPVAALLRQHPLPPAGAAAAP